MHSPFKYVSMKLLKSTQYKVMNSQLFLILIANESNKADNTKLNLKITITKL